MEIKNSGEDKTTDIVKIAEEILNMHLSNRTLINALHILVIQFETHLDTIIKQYKVMSITLLAATIAAIGFSFSGELQDLHVNKLIMASVVCVFGMIGLNALWYIDIQVFHKFWGSFFVEEVKMEEKHPFLVEIGDIAVSLDNIKARLVGDGNWYIFINIILIAIIAIILSFASNSVYFKISIFSVATFVAFFISQKMLKASKKILHVVEQLLSEKEAVYSKS
jgi:hypothetical protein